MFKNDIEQFLTGDVARFARMVDGRGKGIGSLKQWQINITNTLVGLPDVEIVEKLLIEYVGLFRGKYAKTNKLATE